MERTILHRGTSGIILAVNVPRLIAEAKKANGVIEFAPQVGDFVGARRAAIPAPRRCGGDR